MERLGAANYEQTRNAISAISASDTNKVVEIQFDQTTTQIQSGMGGAANAYVVVFNSSTQRGELWYDDNWSTAAGRVQLVTFDDMTAVGEITALNANNFQEWLIV